MFRCFQAKTPMFRSNVNVYAGHRRRGKLLSIGDKRRQRCHVGLRQSSRVVDRITTSLPSACGRLTAARHAVAAAPCCHWTERPSARRRVLICAGSSYFLLVVCSTDSDLRSANASIAASNKRVLRFLLLPRFYSVKLSTFFTC